MVDTGRGWHREQGGGVSGQHAGREHYHGVRQLYEGHEWCSGAPPEDGVGGAEPRLLAVVGFVPAEQRGKPISMSRKRGTGQMGD